MDLYELLKRLPEGMEFLVRPYDSRFEAIVTFYEGGNQFRVVGSSPTEALTRVLTQAVNAPPVEPWVDSLLTGR